jgi:hypothetical protein
MEDFRNRLFSTLSKIVVVYLIQALSFSTVYAGVVSGDFSLTSVNSRSAVSLSADRGTFYTDSILSHFFNSRNSASSNLNSIDNLIVKQTSSDSLGLHTSVKVADPKLRLFSSLSSSSYTSPSDELNLLGTSVRHVDVVGNNIVPSEFIGAVRAVTDLISSNIFNKNSVVISHSQQYSLSVPLVSNFRNLYVGGLSTFVLPNQNAFAASTAGQTTSKNNLVLFDKASLALYCKSTAIFTKRDQDRCDYQKVALGLINKLASTSTTGVLSGIDTSLPKYANSSSTVYISTTTVTYITQYVGVPGPAGKDGKDGKDGRDGTSGGGTFFAVTNNTSTSGGSSVVSLTSGSNITLSSTTLNGISVFNGDAIFNSTLTALGSTTLATTTFTGDVTAGNLTVNNITVTNLATIASSTIGNLQITGALYDSSNTMGNYGQVLVSNGTSTFWSNATGTIIGGTATGSTFFWNGATWIENINLLTNASGDLTVNGDLSVNGDFSVSSTTIGTLNVGTSTAVNTFTTNLVSTNATTTNGYVANLSGFTPTKRTTFPAL